MRTWSKTAAALAMVLAASPVLAAEPERVVVRNRLHQPQGEVELGVQAGVSLVNRLVSHTNLQATAAYNFTNELALELLGGYALSSHTDVANQVNSEVASHSIATKPTDADFAGLWQIQWNAVAGIRWAPIYGKLNLFADVPVHFQMYLGAGGGAAGLRRESVTYCLAASTKDSLGNSLCDNPLVESRVSPVVQFGGGLRFWLGPKAALKLEARDYTFPDRYQVNINRAQAATGDTQAGQLVSSPGFEHVIFVSAGVSYIF